MRSVTFRMTNDTEADTAWATITITEQENGSLLFTVSNENDGDNMIGDIGALFFDVADDSLLGHLQFDDGGNGVITGQVQSETGDISQVGWANNNVNSRLLPEYEVGIAFGYQGIGAGKGDYQTVTFTMSTDDGRALTLDDVAMENFAVRQQSVGEDGGTRDFSDKQWGESPFPVDAQDDTATVYENTVHTSNVFDNDIDLDSEQLTVTAINGDSALVGQQLEIAPDVTVTVDADGSKTVDASTADYLSAGEELHASYTYNVSDDNGGSDSATIDVTVIGVNDNPDAVDDSIQTDEKTEVAGNVLANDSDVDRLDTITVSAVNGDDAAVGSQVTLDSGALLTLNADGTYDYDPNGAFDSLNNGETGTDRFSYTVADGNGGLSTATVTIDIAGISDPSGPDLDGDHFGTFTNKKGVDQEISNIVMYLKDENSDVLKVKIDGWNGGETDLDDVDLASFLESYYLNYDLLGVSIKAGNNHNADLGPGEGQLFLIDGDEDIDYTAGGIVPDGFSLELLGAHADITYSYGSIF